MTGSPGQGSDSPYWPSSAARLPAPPSDPVPSALPDWICAAASCGAVLKVPDDAKVPEPPSELIASLGGDGTPSSVSVSSLHFIAGGVDIRAVFMDKRATPGVEQHGHGCILTPPKSLRKRFGGFYVLKSLHA